MASRSSPQPDDGARVVYKVRGFDNVKAVEDMIDATLAEMNYKVDDVDITKMEKQVKQAEKSAKEINKIFADCTEMLDRFKKSIEEEQGVDSDCESQPIESGSDTDDDVQFIETTYEPLTVSSRPPPGPRRPKLLPKQQVESKPLPPLHLAPQASQLPQQQQQQSLLLSSQQTQQQVGSQHLLLTRPGVGQTTMPTLLQQPLVRLPGNQQLLLVSQPQQQAGGANAQSSITQAAPQMFTLLQQPASLIPQAPSMRPIRPSSTLMLTHMASDGDDVIAISMQPPMTGMRPLIPQPPKHVDLAVGMKLYGKKFNDVWYKGTLVDITNKEKTRTERKYRVKFDSRGLKLLSGKHIAYHENPVDILPVGSRVIAFYRDVDNPSASSYYAGIVAEPPSVRNNHRYLCFFDDGYAQYCTSKELHKVYEQSKNVWDDIHPDSQEFIRGYLQQYPERPMVRLQKGQAVKTEWNGRWWVARVQEVDASLVKMYFDADERVEWIYRGSTRLEPLYTELANAEASKIAGKGRRHNLAQKSNRKPFVEYTRQMEEAAATASAGKTPPGTPLRQLSAETTPLKTPSGEPVKKRPVARKSTAKSASALAASSAAAGPKDHGAIVGGAEGGRILPSNWMSKKLDIEDLLGETKEIKRQLPIRDRKKYVHHKCKPACLKYGETEPVKYKGQNPLLIPQLCGWERQVAKQKNTGKRVIYYRVPCARRLRSIQEVDRYLQVTDSNLAIDMFCFDHVLHTDTEYVPVKTFCDIKDLSYGKENVPISCVNGIDRQYPDYVEYSNQRIPAKGVQLNLDPEFLVGCDCTDGCRDSSKCRCIHRTIEASKACPGARANPCAGYQQRTLEEPVITGVYECNSRCKCDSRCHNRVAQNGLSRRLQVFKTEKRGWGLRCLDDIPAGGFICVYAGQLLTEQGANEDGQQYGDEYLAELDYMEVVERHKDGYESDPNVDEGIGGEDDASSEVTEDDPADTSDSTYSGERYLKAAKNARETKRRLTRKKGDKDQDAGEGDSSEKGIGKLVLKRRSTTGQDKAWTVKAPRTPTESKEAAGMKKAEEWLRNIPDDKYSIVILSDEEGGGGARAVPPGSKSSSSSCSSKPTPGAGQEAAGDGPHPSFSASSPPKGAGVKPDPGGGDDKESRPLAPTLPTPPTSSTKPDEGTAVEETPGGGPRPTRPTTSKPPGPAVLSSPVSSGHAPSVEGKAYLSRKPIRVPRCATRNKSLVPRPEGEGDVKDKKVKAEDKDLSKDKDNDKDSKDNVPKEKGSEHEQDKTDDKMESEFGGLMITEPTSLNIDNVEADSGDEGAAHQGTEGSSATKLSPGDVNYKRTTRSQTSRFRDLPDPRSQKPVSPLKIKLSTMEIQQEDEEMKEQPQEEAMEQEEQEEQPVAAEAVTEAAAAAAAAADTPQEKDDEKKPSFPSTRSYFGEQFSYVMDAKSMGNLGRYLNHSCTPNAFVQNVFVDTHDLRFPWVAFFAFMYIRAGTELTWDYNYEVGSVPGKVLYCYCGSAECRGRLL